MFLPWHAPLHHFNFINLPRSWCNLICTGVNLSVSGLREYCLARIACTIWHPLVTPVLTGMMALSSNSTRNSIWWCTLNYVAPPICTSLYRAVVQLTSACISNHGIGVLYDRSFIEAETFRLGPSRSQAWHGPVSSHSICFSEWYFINRIFKYALACRWHEYISMLWHVDDTNIYIFSMDTIASLRQDFWADL